MRVEYSADLMVDELVEWMVEPWVAMMVAWSVVLMDEQLVVKMVD